MKNKDFNLFNLFSKTFKDRNKVGFIGFDESIYAKSIVNKTDRGKTEETLELPEDYFNSLTKGEK